MDNAKVHRHAVRFLITVLLVACAWLIPPASGIATSSGNLNVRVAVLDSVESRVGQAALKVYNQDLSLTVTKFVIRTASSGLNTETLVDRMKELGTDVGAGLPVGQGAGKSHGDAALDGETGGQATSEEIVITIVRL